MKNFKIVRLIVSITFRDWNSLINLTSSKTVLLRKIGLILFLVKTWMHRENDIAPQISPIWERNGLKGLKILHDTIYWWLNAIRLFFVIRGFKAMHIVIQNKSSWFGSDKLLLKPNKLLRTTGQILIVIFNSDQRWVQHINLFDSITNMKLFLL